MYGIDSVEYVYFGGEKRNKDFIVIFGVREKIGI